MPANREQMEARLVEYEGLPQVFEHVTEPVTDELVIGRFPAFFSSSRFTAKGELSITITVPYKDKYAAVPLTDYAGVMFDVVIMRRGRERNVDENRVLPDGPDEWITGDVE